MEQTRANKGGFRGAMKKGGYFMSNNMDITIIDNSGEVLKELEAKMQKALEEVGITAEGHAKQAAPVGDTGRLRNSISHAVKSSENAVYIGTNVPYAPYVELGTGIYASDGQGRKSPWVYTDSKGEKHYTRGIKPRHFLKNAAETHVDEYKAIIEKVMKE